MYYKDPFSYFWVIWELGAIRESELMPNINYSNAMHKVLAREVTL
jgi:hypothetical protein